MITYLLLNIFIILFPLLLSFESKIKFYTKIKHYLFSIAIVSSIFIIWDYIATFRGDWSFNPKFLTGIYLYLLPLEEILFFITVPYSIIFLFETFKLYLTDKQIYYNKHIYNVIAIIFILISFLFINQYYTFTVFIFTGITFLVLNYLTPFLLKSKVFFILILFTYIPFFIVNYVLTSFPVVEYSKYAIFNIRITTIPIEDFFYSFSLLGLYISFYELSKKLWQKKQL